LCRQGSILGYGNAIEAQNSFYFIPMNSSLQLPICEWPPGAFVGIENVKIHRSGLGCYLIERIRLARSGALCAFIATDTARPDGLCQDGKQMNKRGKRRARLASTDGNSQGVAALD